VNGRQVPRGRREFVRAADRVERSVEQATRCRPHQPADVVPFDWSCGARIDGSFGSIDCERPAPDRRNERIQTRYGGVLLLGHVCARSDILTATGAA